MMTDLHIISEQSNIVKIGSHLQKLLIVNKKGHIFMDHSVDVCQSWLI